MMLFYDLCLKGLRQNVSVVIVRTGAQSVCGIYRGATPFEDILYVQDVSGQTLTIVLSEVLEIIEVSSHELLAAFVRK